MRQRLRGNRILRQGIQEQVCKKEKILLILTISLIVLSWAGTLITDNLDAWFCNLTIRTAIHLLFALSIYISIPKNRVYLKWIAFYLIIYFLVFGNISNYIEIYATSDTFDFIVLCLKIAYGMAIAITIIIVRIKARKSKEEGLFR